MSLLLSGETNNKNVRLEIISGLAFIGMSITDEEAESVYNSESAFTCHSCVMTFFLLKVIQRIQKLENSGGSFSRTTLNSSSRFRYSTACIEMLCEFGAFSFQIDV
jgi:hypothetical protein